MSFKESFSDTQGTLNVSATNRYVVEKAGLDLETSDVIQCVRKVAVHLGYGIAVYSDRPRTLNELTLWCRIVFFLILAHSVYKM